ncbi:MAG: MBOAT family protein [Synergistaceae bacterium]|nr:MBOAT family protein [Synergistaceae bacterium]
MLFNSWQFGIFLPLVFALYWSVPQKLKWLIILISSYWFYMSWNIKYVTLILFTTLISYTAALLLERFNKNMAMKKLILTSTLIACLGVLITFKYFNFFSQSFIEFMSLFAIHLHPVTLKLLLPVGISFYTFQTLGYVIDVYRGKTEAEKHFGIYAAFRSFFPQLVAGPIERTNNLLPQIKAYHEFNYDQAVYGLKLMAWGLFQKLVVSDNLAAEADKIFGSLYDYHGFTLILASMYFVIQIYCDFSGYSDIARGCSKLFGIELMHNFRSPYFSASIKEFWSRWHISLSTWFRDYVYIPLGGNRVSRFRHNINLMITFMISGLWHGANWTFIIWGSLHGLAQIIENAFMKKRDDVHGFKWLLRVICVFLFCSFMWVFFRAQSLNEAMYIFTHMFSGISDIRSYLHADMGAKKIFLAGGLIVAIYDYISLVKGQEAVNLLRDKSAFTRWLVYISLGLAVIIFSPKGAATEFIYFQF